MENIEEQCDGQETWQEASSEPEIDLESHPEIDYSPQDVTLRKQARARKLTLGLEGMGTPH